MSTTKFLNTTSYCGPGQLLPIYNNSKGRFLYIPLMSPAKNQFSLMLSDLFLEMMHPVMSKQRQRPYAVIRFTRYAMIQAGATCGNCP